jgi:polyphosphate kinase
MTRPCHERKLLERLRYLCICSSNLDEFFEVRIASLLANRIEGEHIDPPELSAALERTSIECRQIIARQYANC